MRVKGGKIIESDVILIRLIDKIINNEKGNLERTRDIDYVIGLCIIPPQKKFKRSRKGKATQNNIRKILDKIFFRVES